MSTEETDEGLGHSNQDTDGNPANTETKSNAGSIDLIVELATLRALKELREHRRREWQTIVGFLSAVVIVVTAIGGILVNEILDYRVNKHVKDTVQQRLSEPHFDLKMAAISMEVQALNAEKGGNSEWRLTKIATDLRGLVDEYIRDSSIATEVRNTRMWTTLIAIEDLMELSEALEHYHLMYQFRDIAPKIVLESDPVAQMLMQHTGRTLIGMAGAPEVWHTEDGPIDKYTQYQRYADRANSGNFAELFIAFELVIRHMKSAPRAELLELINDANKLPKLEKGLFVRILVNHQCGRFGKQEDGAADRVSVRFKKFITDYSEALSNIDGSIGSIESCDQ